MLWCASELSELILKRIYEIHFNLSNVSLELLSRENAVNGNIKKKKQNQLGFLLRINFALVHIGLPRRAQVLK